MERFIENSTNRLRLSTGIVSKVEETETGIYEGDGRYLYPSDNASHRDVDFEGGTQCYEPLGFR